MHGMKHASMWVRMAVELLCAHSIMSAWTSSSRMHGHASMTTPPSANALHAAYAGLNTTQDVLEMCWVAQGPSWALGHASWPTWVMRLASSWSNHATQTH